MQSAWGPDGGKGWLGLGVGEEVYGGYYLGGGDLVPTMPGCVCPKVKGIGPFSV